MISGTCHCGAVTSTPADTPEWLTECNCSVCRKLGPLWAHAEASDVTLTRSEDATVGYAWGDRTLEFHTCRTCGCTTHWESLDPEVSTRMAVNCRLADPQTVARLRVRHIDGADTWRYLD